VKIQKNSPIVPQRKNRGFTLTELVVVMVIIGILASMGIPRFRTAITRAKVVEFKMILEQIHSLEESYYGEMDTYTNDFSVLGFDDPKAKYFSFSIIADSSSFTAVATCKADLKGRNGESLNGMKVTLNNKGEHGGDEALRQIARWE